MTPLLYSCYWHAQFEKLARVLECSARVHCPDWEIQIEKLGRPTGLTSAMGVSAHVDNTHKLERWKAILDQAEDGRPILLIDTDTVILRELEPIWRQDFDVAFTTKPADSRFPLNGGVMFVRAGAASRWFLAKWAATNRVFLTDRRYSHNPLRKKFGGINQAALGAVLQQTLPDVRVCELPCSEWNCEDESWQKFGPQTRILHIKSGLRREVLKLYGPRPKFAHADCVQAWKQYEKLASSPAVVSPSAPARASVRG